METSPCPTIFLFYSPCWDPFLFFSPWYQYSISYQFVAKWKLNTITPLNKLYRSLRMWRGSGERKGKKLSSLKLGLLFCFFAFAFIEKLKQKWFAPLHYTLSFYAFSSFTLYFQWVLGSPFCAKSVFKLLFFLLLLLFKHTKKNIDYFPHLFWIL